MTETPSYTNNNAYLNTSFDLDLMLQRLDALYRFLPVQLFLLHFRKYQVIMIFWIMLFAVVTGNLATHFGAASLFLSPEYLGKINVASFFLLGGATAIFAMSWHITTFIIHSKRVPFLGATRHSFLKYCVNNSIIPLCYLIVFGIMAARYLSVNEAAGTGRIISLLSGFYSGYIIVLLLSFLYFFRVDRNILKLLLGTIANPSVIREFIPYDSLDREFDMVRADSYLNTLFKVEQVKTPYEYNHRFLTTVLRRHHRNAILAVFCAVVMLLVMGIFMEEPLLRIPAGAGFLLLFSVMMTAVGAFKYFLRSWEIIGWIVVFAIAGVMARHKIFDLRSIAYGMKYEENNAPVYNYEHLKHTFSDSLYLADKTQEEERLKRWKTRVNADQDSTAANVSRPPLVIISVSGGGSRSAYWTFRCLQYADSLSGGKLFSNTVLISGASGGMIGAAYWRSVHTQCMLDSLPDPYSPVYQDRIGKDLLNAVIFSLACVDLISPFNKITVAGRRYSKDRGYAFDQELASNTEGLLDKRLRYFQPLEANGLIPMLVVGGTVINDGRRVLISPLPVTYLTRSETSLGKAQPIIDAVDFTRFFKDQDPLNLQLMSALRMSATFPIVLPVVKLPSVPEMNVMDAGLRDNFGNECAVRYLSTFCDWFKEQAGDVILLQVRDTRLHEPSELEEENSMTSMLSDPLFAIQKKWSSFQTYHQSYEDDYIRKAFPENKIHRITLQYIPENKDKSAALNFHLTSGKRRPDVIGIQQGQYAGVRPAAAAAAATEPVIVPFRYYKKRSPQLLLRGSFISCQAYRTRVTFPS